MSASSQISTLSTNGGVFQPPATRKTNGATAAIPQSKAHAQCARVLTPAALSLQKINDLDPTIEVKDFTDAEEYKQAYDDTHEEVVRASEAAGRWKHRCDPRTWEDACNSFSTWQGKVEEGSRHQDGVGSIISSGTKRSTASRIASAPSSTRSMSLQARSYAPSAKRRADIFLRAPPILSRTSTTPLVGR